MTPEGVIPGHPDVLLKVCVLFKQDIGRILTAFAAEIPKAGEDIYGQSNSTDGQPLTNASESPIG